MAKREEENKTGISLQMVKNCKNMIAKFGFSFVGYEKFLIAVKALKTDGKTVLQYSNNQIADYQSAYIKKAESTLSDAFILDKFKILTSNENGKQYETGYFCPRSFWDFIYDYKLN